jgi:hypothetical protein
MTILILQRLNFFYTSLIYTNSVRISQETHYVSTKKTNRFMLFRGKISFFCENHTKHTVALRWQDAEFYYVKLDGTYSKHWALKGY